MALRRLHRGSCASDASAEDSRAMSHFAFVNPGGPKVPDLLKAAHYGITRLYWQANDPQLDASLLDAVSAKDFEVGIMRDPSWDHLSAIDLARTLDADLTRLGHGNAQCAVLADIEHHDAAYILAFLHEWRSLRPQRLTGWTLEPLQGGWVTDALVVAVGLYSVSVFPQTYLGNMSPVAPDLARCDLIERGISRGHVGAVYSARDIPTHWDGIAFPFHELP